jgi:hypothetical protein
MPTATMSEYLTLSDVPLSCEAWSTENLSSFLDGPGVRGADLVNPSRSGEIPRRRTLAARTFTIPLTVNGYYDTDDNPSADPRATLLANLDYLKALFTPDPTTLTGTRVLQWVTPDGTREGDVHVNPALSIQTLGPHAARLVVDVTLPGGVLRDTDESLLPISINHNQTSKTHTITVPGNVEIQDARIEVDGTSGDPSCDSFRIENLTYDASGGVFVEYDATVNDPLIIYADTYTATHGATQVGGSITNGGSAIWLPLRPGENSLRVLIPGNTVNCHVHVHVKGAWA